MTDDTTEIEYSPLCKRFTREGITVDVRIYRMREEDSGWSLEVVDHNDCSTVWDELFPTDQQAYKRFSRLWQMRAFTPSWKIHRRSIEDASTMVSE